ncbi:TPA: hypothetical protein RMI67_004514 [Bacillus cereus]|nr:hypothetical protein [Bacillus cereus]
MQFNVSININNYSQKGIENMISESLLPIKKIFIVKNSQQREYTENVANQLENVISTMGIDCPRIVNILRNITPIIGILNFTKQTFDNYPSIPAIIQLVPPLFFEAERTIIRNDLINDDLFYHPRLYAFEQTNRIQYLLITEFKNTKLNVQALSFAQQV